jgi:tetratricopeptide (TPR) repeat protein
VGAATPDQSAGPLGADTLYTRTAPAVVRIEVRDEKFKGLCTGTGFFVSGDGLLVTNHHVIEGGAFATVETSDGTTLFVEGVAAVDKVQDLALLKVKAAGLKCLDLGHDERPPVGTRVFAIGHPRGVKNSVLSEGLVSSVGEAIGGDVASIATTAPVSHGSSGGPLVTADGTVVGVITAGREDAQNMNFAVPVLLVRKLMKAGGAGTTLKALASAGGSSLDREQAAVLRKAWAAIDRGRLRDAAQILGDARGRMHGSNAYWVTAGTLHMELKNYAVAADAFQNAVRLKGDAIDSHAMLGAALALQEKYREAIKSFEAASRLAPRDPKYHAAAARCHMELKHPDRAVAFYKKAVQLAPGDAAYVARVGDAYFAMEQYADALMAYEKALKVNASDADTHVSLAQCHVNLRRPEDADAPLRKALSLDSRNARAHLQAGKLQSERGELVAALASFQAAAKFDPGGPVGKAGTAAADLVQKELDRRQAQVEQQRAQQQQQLEQAPPQQRRVYRVVPRTRQNPPRRLQ